MTLFSVSSSVDKITVNRGMPSSDAPNVHRAEYQRKRVCAVVVVAFTA
jgi:hypothetical protein